MARTRRRTSFRSAGRRRKRVWARNQAIPLAPGFGDPVGIDLLANFRSAGEAGYQPVGMTYMGARISFAANAIFGTAPAAGTAAAVSITWGVIVEDRDSTLAELPDPATDEGRDWLYWERTFLPNAGLAATTRVMQYGDIGQRLLRSRRKVEEYGDTVYLLASAGGQTDVGQTFNMVVAASSLILLA